MYTHSYDAKVMRMTRDNAMLEVDLGFRVWKIQHIELDDDVNEMYRAGTRVRLSVRMERVSSGVGAPHVYYGKLTKL